MFKTLVHYSIAVFFTFAVFFFAMIFLLQDIKN